jgi:hypothetical protein
MVVTYIEVAVMNCLRSKPAAELTPYAGDQSYYVGLDCWVFLLTNMNELKANLQLITAWDSGILYHYRS